MTPACLLRYLMDGKWRLIFCLVGEEFFSLAGLLVHTVSAFVVNRVLRFTFLGPRTPDLSGWLSPWGVSFVSQPHPKNALGQKGLF